MEIELHLSSDTPAARWANGLARELVAARALAGREPNEPGQAVPRFVLDAYARAVSEILDDTAVPIALAERIGYILAALSATGAAGMWAAASLLRFRGMSEEELEALAGNMELDEDLDRVLELVSQHLAQTPGSL